jgi:hypothetical protein
MKTKKTLTKKLVLNKKTIAALTGEDLRRSRGGDPTMRSICRTDCLSCYDLCELE